MLLPPHNSLVISFSVSCKKWPTHALPFLHFYSITQHGIIAMISHARTTYTITTATTSKPTIPSTKTRKIIPEMAITRHVDEENHPLLQDSPFPDPVQKNLIQQAISQTFQSTAHLANLLPTGTVLAFQLLSPIFSNQGVCDSVSRTMTAVLIGLCGFSCFVLSFSDSYRDDNGNVCYGFVTYRGLWVMDGSTKLAPELASKFRIRGLDFVHAMLSVLVFGAIAMFDGNVVHCFYPEPSVEAGEVLSALPIGVGVMCSMLFVVFPPQRHGIGFPLSS